jgi:YesN/AraC family two-component response regulator
MFRIYIVDDEPLVLQEFANNPLFAENGFQVVGASTQPSAAIKEIRKKNPDAVFADLKMPACSGIDLIETLCEKGGGCEFVIISAYPDFEESRRFFRLGGLDYLLKPVSDHDLQALLDKLSCRLAVKSMKSVGVEKTASVELNQMIAYMKEHLVEKLTLEQLSQEHHFAINSICRLFANHLGTTFGIYLTKLRMAEAARLLAETTMDVVAIGNACGYTDYFYFCRVFREYYLCAPTEFRGGKGATDE